MIEWIGSATFAQPSAFELFWHDTPIFFKIFALVFLFIIIYATFKGIKQWMVNNASELLTVSCTAVSKRFRVRGGSGDTSASTDYYVTFETPNGDRVELEVPDRLYGLIVEGDRGELTYQGTRFKGFERESGRDSMR
ncbi:Protein of unknown function [Paenibacillus sophorae]|uniref:DUF2500 domain-containing protein n=1 Tax=Paenibacillus sophorae TaxID=1333845 RepID=A0A1H8JWR1_9BACL|nr:DUF2500 domain-containing protein [Paenibacillus sophorae]QWU13507.1 DUF2500 domain-containing protein [Paenibacillus sophorae]SEN84945.1 Protein of unknown function [Paenibacillus sophorae]